MSSGCFFFFHRMSSSSLWQLEALIREMSRKRGGRERRGASNCAERNNIDRLRSTPDEVSPKRMSSKPLVAPSHWKWTVGLPE